MIRTKRRRTALVAAGAMVVAGLAAIPTTQAHAQDDPWVDRFLEQYEKIKTGGYFSPEGIPYHSVETLIVEAPEHGHQTTSEAFSYWLWLEANYGRATGDWAPFNDAWATMEEWIIPSSDLQPTNANYNPADPATFAPELDSPGEYPSPLDFDVPVGQDPIADELASTYGSPDVYGMHWLMDVDNVAGFGRCGDGEDAPAMVNTYQRGPQESVWQTIAHPSCERFNYGGPNGFLDLFIDDEEYAQQWRYTNAPDADARAVQAAYWAQVWAEEQGNAGQISDTVANAAKMGDWLRYAFFDKYFKEIGCTDPSCPGATGKDSSHYLLQWYYAWGGGLGADWAFRIGASHNHQGYQNPMAAWALAGNVPELTPESATGADDWATSLDRQLEFYRWLQANPSDPNSGGFIAGGATNSWNGRYDSPPAGAPTFYDMAYDEDPVWHDPPSNRWFGFQAWSLQRVAEYLYVTGDSRAQEILDPWVARAMSETTINADGTYLIPSDLSWSGAPDDWNPNSPGANTGLSVSVENYTDDVGVAAAYARTLMYYAAAVEDTEAQTMSLDLIEGLYSLSDDLGVSVTEVREDYERFDDPFDDSGIPITGMYVPDGFSGTMPNGDVIEPGITKIDIMSYYLDDPDWPQVQAYLDGGPAPEFNYHRSWAQMDVANAYADYAFLFGGAEPGPGQTESPGPSESPAPSESPGQPGTDCTVAYQVTSDWGSGFQADVTVTNNTNAAISGWEVEWAFPGGQQVDQLWGGVHSQSGADVTVANESWNATIPAGGSVSIGFLGSPGGGNSPSSFLLSGTACTSA